MVILIRREERLVDDQAIALIPLLFPLSATLVTGTAQHSEVLPDDEVAVRRHK
jgi:hypothetical protein